jgi:hypothetical protein
VAAIPNNEIERPTNTAPVAQTVIVQETSLWPWVFLPLWLLTLLAWFISAKRPFAKKSSQAKNSNSVNSTYLELMAACKQNNGEAALTQLMPWARSQSASAADAELLTTLDALHSHFNDPAFSSALTELQQSYYGKAPGQWLGNNLLQAIQNLHKKDHKAASSSDMSINP